MIESAISVFRKRGSILKTAVNSAEEMRATAASLFNTSGHTSRRAENAMQVSEPGFEQCPYRSGGGRPIVQLGRAKSISDSIKRPK